MTKVHLAPETGLYYYGARYLDPKYSMWLSCDPALGEYMVGSDAGCGGVYNSVNLNLYHYANNNPVKYTDPTGMWVDNEDGTFTAEEGDTLWGLQQETGRDWSSSDFNGSPENLQIGQVVSFGKKNVADSVNGADSVTIDSTMNAVKHYYFGNGASVNLGEKTINILKNSPEHIYNKTALANGTAKSETQSYDVNLTSNPTTYHVGETNVTYEKSEGTKYRVVTYNAFVEDGFWDVLSKEGDRVGPKKELPVGTPYSYIPYSWTEVYKK